MPCRCGADELIGYGDIDASEFVGRTLAARPISCALSVGTGTHRQPCGSLSLNVSSEVGEARADGADDGRAEPVSGHFIVTVSDPTLRALTALCETV